MGIIISGASGFIGQHLTRYYLDKGEEVIAVVPHPEKMERFISAYPKLKVVKAGFEDYDHLSDMIKVQDAPDIFYYLTWGGYGKATNDYREQVRNVKPVCDAIVEAKKLGAKRFLFASSLSEYMVKKGSMQSHEHGAVCNVYGSTKQAARIMAQAVADQQEIPFISIAFANTFGPGDSSKRSTNMFIHQLLSGQDLNLTEGTDMYDWNYIDDSLNGLVLAGEKGKSNELYYIGNRTRRTLCEIVTEVRDILAPNAKIHLGKYRDDFYMDYSRLDVHKLYRDTGYLAKTDFKEAVLATSEWVKNMKWE